MNFSLWFFWHDKRLVGKNPAKLNWVEIWKPKHVLINNASLEEEEFMLQLEDPKTGLCQKAVRFKGAVSVPMGLQDFPFDKQTGVIIVATPLKWEEMKFKRSKRIVTFSAKESELTAKDWIIKRENTSIDHIKKEYVGGKVAASRLRFNIPMTRTSSYFFWKVMFISYLMTFLSWTQYTLDPGDFGTRMSIMLTLFLAAVAFMFVIGDSLPKIPYLTCMDKFLFSNFMSLFVICIEDAIVNYLSTWNLKNPNATPIDVETIDSSLFYVIAGTYVLFNIWLFGPVLYRKHRLQRDPAGTTLELTAVDKKTDTDGFDYIVDAEST